MVIDSFSEARPLLCLCLFGWLILCVVDCFECVHGFVFFQRFAGHVLHDGVDQGSLNLAVSYFGVLAYRVRELRVLFSLAIYLAEVRS